jgi:hypothetical protein
MVCCHHLQQGKQRSGLWRQRRDKWLHCYTAECQLYTAASTIESLQCCKPAMLHALLRNGGNSAGYPVHGGCASSL